MSLDDVLSNIKEQVNYRKEATISGIKFEIGLLSLREEGALSAIDIDGMDGIAYINETRKITLSYAIKKINGEVISDIVETKDDKGEPVTKEKAVYLRDFLDSIPSKITEDLFEIYADFREEKEKQTEDQVLYEWYKTPEVRNKEREENMRSFDEKNKEEQSINFTELQKEEESEEPEDKKEKQEE